MEKIFLATAEMVVKRGGGFGDFLEVLDECLSIGEAKRIWLQSGGKM